MANTQVNLTAINKAVDKCCKTVEECGECKKSKCLIGFAREVLHYAEERDVLRIPNGQHMLPEYDFKVYYPEDLISALVSILSRCNNCEENHVEECVINVSRMALELALLTENVPFAGSVFNYLMQVGRTDPEMGAKLLAEYKKLRAVS